jgi:Uma2 family endonuclease
MLANDQPIAISEREYLASEELSPVKHEYIDGYVYAMAEASDAHVTISLNFATRLKTHLRGSTCRVFISDMRLNLAQRRNYYYPDVLVTCDESDRSLTNAKRNPCLIVEVLFPSTEAFDRGDKFTDYQQIASLQDYILVSQTRQRIDYFKRSDGALWFLESYYPGDTFNIGLINCEIAVNDIYEDVDSSLFVEDLLWNEEEDDDD